MKTYFTRFNKECLTINDQDEKITLAALLGWVWPRSPFMAELARRTPLILREFMDKADDYINAENTLKALVALRKDKDLQRFRGWRVSDKTGWNYSDKRQKKWGPPREWESRSTHSNMSVRLGDQSTDRIEAGKAKKWQCFYAYRRNDTH